MRINYRKIYEQHYGPIPTEKDGRKYEIHHIDGNHSNNDPSNLIAVTFEEHYDIHYAQGDWHACVLMAKQRGKSVEEISRLNSLAQKKRVSLGTHNFLGGKKQKQNNQRRVANGTHQFLDGSMSRKVQNKRVKDGTHHFVLKVSCVCCKEENTLANYNRNHKENCSGPKKPKLPYIHTSCTKISCLGCKKIITPINFKRWHGENCKLLKEETQ